MEANEQLLREIRKVISTELAFVKGTSNLNLKYAISRIDAHLAQPEAAEPLQLPPLTDLMYHAVRGSEYHFSSGGPGAVAGYLDDDCLDEIWDNINTALRTARVAVPVAAQPTERERELLGLLEWLRNSPTYDDGGPQAEAMDQALAGKPIKAVARMNGFLSQISAPPMGAAQPEAEGRDMTPKRGAKATPKSIVLAEWPDAKCMLRLDQTGFNVWNPDSTQGLELIGRGSTPQAAWSDAANRLTSRRAR